MSLHFPEIPLATDEPLSEILDYILDRFSGSGFIPQPLEEILSQLPAAGQVALFSVITSENLHLFFVVTAPWTEELLMDTLNSALALRQAARTSLQFHFLSAYPLPALLGYLFGEGAAAQLECEALLELQFDLESPVEPHRINYLARQTQRWLQLYFHHTLYPDDLEALAWLDTLILNLPSGEDYEPMPTLISLGYLIGEILLHQPDLQGRWLPQSGLGGALLELSPTQSVNPIAWVLDRYRRETLTPLLMTAADVLMRISELDE